MERICNIFDALKPGLLMAFVQILSAALNVLYKLAANDGMSSRIVVAYRFLFATAFMVPLALIFERKKRPKLTWIIVAQAFLSALLGGSLAQNLYVESLALTTATFVSAMANLIPAITFALAVCSGLEKLNLASLAGMAKVIGTIIGIGGAMVLTFCKGPEINIWSTHFDLLHHHDGQPNARRMSHHNHALGTLLAVLCCLSYALWLIIQAKMSTSYPCLYSSTALMCIMGSVQSVVYAVCTEKDWKQWKLGWNIRLLSVAYAGIAGSGLMVILISWGLNMRGPLFVTSFNPLMLVLVAIAGSLVLDEKLYLGSVLGAALIVGGLYVVIWGTGKGTKVQELSPSKSSREVEMIDNVVNTSSTENTFNNKNNLTNRDVLERV